MGFGIKTKIIGQLAERYAGFYLKRMSKKHINTPIKVGFIVFEPESWDKQQPVFEYMLKDSDFLPKLIVLPSFDTDLSLKKKYGYELQYFKNKYSDVLLGYNQDGSVINLKKYGFDYVFYQDPYDNHYPKGLKSKDLVKFTRICLIPYGYTLSSNFENLVSSNLFFRMVNYLFSDIKATGRIIETNCKKNIENGYKRVFYYGYPAFQSYLCMKQSNINDKITWAPRWSNDPVVGGSHFMQYKEFVLEMAEEFPNEKIMIRPHPMLFSNLIATGELSERDKDKYLHEMNERGIELNERGAIDDVLKNTKVLIADYSSIIASFFATGRPIIYCDSIFEPTEEFRQMLDCMYVAHSWNEVLMFMHNILEGNDYLEEKRKQMINKGSFEIHKYSTQRIVGQLKNVEER